MSWVAVATFAVGAGSTLYSGQQAKKAQKRNEKMQQPFMDSAKESLAQGKQYNAMGMPLVQSFIQRNNQLAGGNIPYLMSMFGPEITQMGQAGRAGMRAGMNLSSRGGMSADRMGGLADSNRMNLMNLLGGGRMQAMNNLGSMGTNLLNLGNSATSQGQGAGMNLLNFNQRGDQINMQNDAAMGEALAGLFGSYLNRPKSAAKTGGAGANAYGGDTSTLFNFANAGLV